MKQFSAVLLGAFVVLCAGAVFAGNSWTPLTPRRDFPVDDPEGLARRACEILEADDNLHMKDLSRAGYYINAVRSEKYGVDVILVLIEDRVAPSPNVYGFVFFELPDRKPVSVGAALFDMPLDQWLEEQLYEMYDEEFEKSI